MALNVPVLERSFNLVAPQSERFAARFFERLFEKYPRFKSYFILTDMNEQQRRFNTALVMIVQNLRNPQQMYDFVRQLGVRHLDYGTRPEHFEAFGENLLSVLAEISGHAWNDESAAAWRDVYQMIADMMIRTGWPVCEPVSV